MYKRHMDTGDQQRVMEAAIRAAGGDLTRAEIWYHQEKLKAFSEKTPAQLVLEGRTADLLRYIESLEQGPAG